MNERQPPVKHRFTSAVAVSRHDEPPNEMRSRRQRLRFGVSTNDRFPPLRQQLPMRAANRASNHRRPRSRPTDARVNQQFQRGALLGRNCRVGHCRRMLDKTNRETFEISVAKAADIFSDRTGCAELYALDRQRPAPSQPGLL